MMSAPTLNPVVVMVEMELAMLEAGRMVGEAALCTMGRICGGMDRSAGMAAEKRRRCESPEDSDFTTHYGRRIHDIDPERDV